MWRFRRSSEGGLRRKKRVCLFSFGLSETEISRLLPISFLKLLYSQIAFGQARQAR